MPDGAVSSIMATAKKRKTQLNTEWARTYQLSHDALASFRALLTATLGEPSSDLRTVDPSATSDADLVMLLASQVSVVASRSALSERARRKVKAALAALREEPPAKSQDRTVRALEIVAEALQSVSGDGGSNAAFMLYELGSKVDPAFAELSDADVDYATTLLTGVRFVETSKGELAKREKVRSAENILAKLVLRMGAFGEARHTRPSGVQVDTLTKTFDRERRRFSRE
jgi:hypothetical protein